MVDKKELKEDIAPVSPELAAQEPPVEAVAPTEETEAMPPAEEAPTNNLVVVVKRFLPGEEVTPENVQDLAVQTIERLSGIQDKLIGVAEEYPDFATMLNDVLKGMPPDEAIARNFDEGVMNPPEDAPDWDRIGKAKGERQGKLSELKARSEKFTSNKQLSVENAEAFIKETELDEESALAFLDWYDKLNEDMSDGLITMDHFKALYKGYVHDGAMAGKDAEMAGEVEAAKVAGRNEQIEKKKIKAEKGDGVPKLSTSGEAKTKKKKSYASSYFDDVI